jgi:hypothetical protein
MRLGRGLQKAAAIAAAVLALTVATGSASAERITPHLLTPHEVSPQLVTPPASAPAPEPPPPELTEPVEPEEAPETAESAEPAESTAPVASPDASPHRGQEGPTCEPDGPTCDPGDDPCPGPECNRCPQSNLCPDPRGTLGLRSDGPLFSSLADDPKFAICAGSRALLMLMWPDYLDDDPELNFLLFKGLRIFRYPGHRALPEDDMTSLLWITHLWNWNCQTWLSG